MVTRKGLNALELTNPTAAVGEIVSRNYVLVSPADSVWRVVAQMRSTDSAFALVATHDGDLSAGGMQGIITRKDIINVLADDMDVFGV
jgi:CBS domain containing-hemolysin-like protein